MKLKFQRIIYYIFGFENRIVDSCVCCEIMRAKNRCNGIFEHHVKSEVSMHFIPTLVFTTITSVFSPALRLIFLKAITKQKFDFIKQHKLDLVIFLNYSLNKN